MSAVEQPPQEVCRGRKSLKADSPFGYKVGLWSFMTTDAEKGHNNVGYRAHPPYILTSVYQNTDFFIQTYKFICVY